MPINPLTKKRISDNEWYTDMAIIHALGPFDLDPACGPQCTNQTAPRRYGPAEDGLIQQWAGRVWLNPPYDNVPPWIKKLSEHGDGIDLVFNRQETLWFQEAAKQAGWVFSFRKRLHFSRPGGGSGVVPLGNSLLPFGRRNVAAIMAANLPGILYKVT